MEFCKLDHVAIVAKDSDVSKNWYLNALGMEWVYQGLWGGNPIFLKKGECFMAIFQAGKSPEQASRRGTRIDHFAFRIESRELYEAAKVELKEKGIDFDEQNHEISLSIYLEDPDGITVELTTYDL